MSYAVVLIVTVLAITAGVLGYSFIGGQAESDAEASWRAAVDLQSIGMKIGSIEDDLENGNKDPGEIALLVENLRSMREEAAQLKAQALALGLDEGSADDRLLGGIRMRKLSNEKSREEWLARNEEIRERELRIRRENEDAEFARQLERTRREVQMEVDAADRELRKTKIELDSALTEEEKIRKMAEIEEEGFRARAQYRVDKR